MQLRIDVRRAQPRRRGVLVSILVALPVAFALLAILAPHPPHGFDRSISRAAYDLTSSSGLIDHLSQALAWAFRNDVVLAFLGVLALVALWQRRYRIAMWLVASGLIAVYGNKLLKEIFERPRPDHFPPLATIGGHSFPSGHSTAGAVVTTVLILLTISMTHRGWRRNALVTTWATLGVAVAGSRVLLGVHYPTDVLAGLCFGSFVAFGLWVLIPADPRRLRRSLRVITGSTTRRVAVILNPAKVGDVDTFKSRLRSVADPAGWGEPLWLETTVEDPGRGQTHQALEAGVDLLVVAGGDGTVREVCEEAARTGVPVGIIPHGTGNLLARNLGIPLNSRAALEVAFEGQDKACDLVTYETDSGVETVFLVMAGLGFDAAIMTGVDPELKDRIGSLAYFVSGIKALRFPSMTVTVTVDEDEPVTMKAKTVVVGNVGFLQGGLPLMPDARIDDGLLDVIILAPRRLIDWLTLLARVIARRPTNPTRLARFSGARVHIETPVPAPMQLDGDPVGEGTSITAQAHPGVLLLRVPR